MITGKKAMACAERFFMTHNANDQELFDYLMGQNLDAKGINRKPTVKVCVGKKKNGHKIFADRPVKISKMYRKMIRSGRIA